MVTGIAETTAAIELIQTARKQGWLDSLVTALRKKHKIILLGSTGTGKTNFVTSLTETIPNAIDIMNRTAVAQKYRVKIQKQPFIFIDTPGQLMHKSRRLAAIRQAMGSGISGIINVVSYGYHEYRIGSRDAVKGDGTVSEAFLEEHRQVEIESLREWVPILGGPEAAGWLMTVVTKADLWWDRRDEVMDYYQSGSYYQALSSAQSLHPVVLEYCSVFKKYFGKARMSGVFDDPERVRAKAHLIQELLAAIGKVSKA
jgi:energy-coupling factor transporter ATP-binding protein EcfA2